MNRKKSDRLASRIRSALIPCVARELSLTIGSLDYPGDGEEDINILRIMERVFSTKQKGLKLKPKDVKHWPMLFDRCEKILEASSLGVYPEVILRETLAHRYSDYYRLHRKYENRFNECYGFAFKASSENNIYSHKDASSFWNGTAYLRCGKIAKASKSFLRVMQNRLSFRQTRMHQLKVQASFDFFLDHPDYVPDNMGDCVAALIEQNDRFREKFKVGISKDKINKYKRWLI